MEEKPKKDKREMIKKKWFIQENLKNISEKYDIKNKQQLGEGAFGIVYKVALLDNPSEFRVMKAVAKSSLRVGESDKVQFANEIRCLQILDHPNIIKLYEIFEDQYYIYLIQELCEGGELFDKIIDCGGFNEAQAKYYFRQMIEAIHYCHEKNISHSDLKPENIMMLNKEDKSPIKVIDFGLSMIKGTQRKQGSDIYMSPEVKQDKADPLTDIWALGIILYVMMCGRFPIEQQRAMKKDPITGQEKKVIRKIFKQNFEKPEFKNASEDLKELLKGMARASTERLTSKQVLEHPWLQKDESEQQKSIEKLQIDSLRAYTKSNQLRKTILVHIATNLQESDILELQDIFKSLDQDSSGSLTFDDLKQGMLKLKNNNHNEQQLKRIFESLDGDGSGTIYYTEFIAACLQQSDYLQTEKLITIFKEIDKDDDGQLSLQEIRNYMKHKIDNEGTFVNEISQKAEMKNSDQMLLSNNFGSSMKDSVGFYKKIVNQYDKNGDGLLDFEEFKKLMESPDLINMQNSLNLSWKQSSQEMHNDGKGVDDLLDFIEEVEEK